MWVSTKRVIKYVLGCALCLVGLVVGLSGQLTVSKNGGPAHPDKMLQYLIGGGIFLVGILFLVAAAKTRAKRSGVSRVVPGLPPPDTPEPLGVIPQSSQGWEWVKNPDPNAHPADGGWRVKGEGW